MVEWGIILTLAIGSSLVIAIIRAFGGNDLVEWFQPGKIALAGLSMVVLGVALFVILNLVAGF